MVVLLQFLMTGRSFRAVGAAGWSHSISKRMRMHTGTSTSISRRGPRVIQSPSLLFRGGGSGSSSSMSSSSLSTVSCLSGCGALLGLPQQQQQRQQSRSFWMVRGGGVQKELEDLSKNLPSIDPLLGYPVSVCSVQGFRSYMEDEFVVTKDCCAVFDGHGGQAVSRYLRQNLYASLQAALPTTAAAATAAATANNNINNNNNNNVTNTQDSVASDKPQDGVASSVGSKADTIIDTDSTTLSATLSATANPVKMIPPTVQDYCVAMRSALDKVDREVQRIVHWSYQGSTAVAAWIHEEKTTTTTATAGDSNVDTGSDNGDENSSSSIPPTSLSPKQRQTIITANVGDSRAILSRNGSAIDLTRDHKPNDPIEEARIEAKGGYVAWCGDMDTHGNPIEGSGIYRVNGNLALSRAIGDRSERPAVSAEPDITMTTITARDEFLVLATDGLWDVMSSSDVVAFIHALLEAAADNEAEREYIATSVVEEALRRGTWDNVTVIIVWLNASNNIAR
jgi:serine/threonine protein phosphatase PrpC